MKDKCKYEFCCQFVERARRDERAKCEKEFKKHLGVGVSLTHKQFELMLDVMELGELSERNAVLEEVSKLLTKCLVEGSTPLLGYDNFNHELEKLRSQKDKIRKGE
jgi:hypothetical protein